MSWCVRLPTVSFVAFSSRVRWACAFAFVIVHQAGHAAAPAGNIYLIGDDADAIHLSDRSDLPSARLLMAPEGDGGTALDRAPVQSTSGDDPRSARQDRKTSKPDPRLAGIVERAALEHRIEPEFLWAVIDVESGSSARAVSPRGAQGLMQLMPATAREFGVSDPFDPRQNVRAGALHLRRMLDRFGEDKALALAAYNAGAAAVIRHRGQIPPYAETMAYVPRVLQRFSTLLRTSKRSAPSLRTFP